MMEEEKKWKIQDLWGLIKDSLVAILKGRFLLRLNIGQYFMHIVYFFLMCALLIWFSLGVDSTLAKVEKNQEVLKELEIQHSNLEFELRTLDRRAALQEMLEESGSKVTGPQKPATVLKK